MNQIFKNNHIAKYIKTIQRLSIFTVIMFLSIALNEINVMASPLSDNGKLQVKGNNIVNSSGKPYVIKGVSTHGIAWYPQYISKNAFKTLKSRGINTIRLAMYTTEYNGYCVAGASNRTQLISKIHKGVTAATELGMYVIIDWHILSDGNPLQYKSMANSFFKQMAKKYKSYKNVMFEICNEPNGSGGKWKNIASYANTIIKTIREQNNNSIIIVGTPTWSQDVDIAANKPLKGKNIAYAFHFYAATHKQNLRDKLTKAVKKGLPIIVTEYGLSEASGNGSINIKEGNTWKKLLDKYKIGRVCWNLSNKNETCALIKPSCKKLYGWKKNDLTKQGQWFLY